MKRILSILLCILLVIMCFTGCKTSNKYYDKEETETSAEYKLVYSGSDGQTVVGYLVDTRTDVMYMFVKGGYGGGLSVMLNSNGDPLTYTEWSELDNNPQ